MITQPADDYLASQKRDAYAEYNFEHGILMTPAITSHLIFIFL